MSEQVAARLAGSYELLQLSIASLTTGRIESIRGLVHRLDIKESVNKTFITGTITVTDATDLLSRVPIQGNELLVVETKDYYGAILKECYKVFAISDYKYVSERDENLVQYTLHFCSREKFIADTMSVRRAFRGKIHEQALELYDQYIGTFEDSQLKGEGINVAFKGITVQETDGEHVYTIPNMKPDQALNFLAKRAYSADTPAGVFKFWETRKGFHFLSLQGSETAYKFRYNRQIPHFYYSTSFQNLPYLQDEKMKQIVGLGLNKSFNTADAFRRGGYTSRVVEVDILNRTPIETRYNHIDEVANNPGGTYKALNSSISTKQTTSNVNAYFTEGPEFLVIKDYPSVGTDTGTLPTADVQRAIRSRQEYAENTVKRLAYNFQLEQNKIEVTVHGSYAVFAGAYIYLSIPPNTINAQSQSEDSTVSGYYLVDTCTHVYDGNTYTCKLIATRPGDRATNETTDLTQAFAQVAATTAGDPASVILDENRNETLPTTAVTDPNTGPR